MNRQRGHYALAHLEQMGALGVSFEDRPEYYDPDETDEYYFGIGQQRLTILTQNVDSLHQRAGSKHVVQIHGAGGVVKCMSCGKRQDRNDYHSELELVNSDWLEDARRGYENS